MSEVELSQLKIEKIEELTLNRESILENLENEKDSTIKTSIKSDIDSLERDILKLLKEFKESEKNEVLDILKGIREGKK